MKRKDDLLRLAFGELTDDAARALEARADDAERAEIEAFRRLHDGLRHLPSPPPDNLTAERLRAAILDRELKVRRPFAWGSVLLAPAALAAIAAVVFLPRLRPRPEPQIVVLNDPPVEARHRLISADAFRPLEKSAFEVQAPTALPRAQAKVASVVPEEETAQKRTRHRHSRHRSLIEPVDDPQIDTNPYVVVMPPSEGGDAQATLASMSPTRESPQTIAAPASAVVEAAPGGAGKTETVVIVSSKRDLETGAPAATEREATSVLVGG